MKYSALKVLLLSFLTSFGCLAQDNKSDNKQKKEPHRYGGWYCPDNLGGFPAVDIRDWEMVPVVNGRMPTKEETQNGTSLIFVDAEKYPNAKPLDMNMPQMARYYNGQSNTKELIIIIQAVNVDNDSIVGFRYLNGGNGSARLDEVELLSDDEIHNIPSSQFVRHDITINATQDEIWKVMTDPENAKKLQSTFDKNNKLNADWRSKSNVNYNYPKSGFSTSAYARKLFGNFYVQNTYFANYDEKFLLLENQETKTTTLKISCGPFRDNYEEQSRVLMAWATKIKDLSEG
ncbi:MAG: hypothetical protein HKO66_00010 [Saprospiraceae bacterium]|nr:hypothetical protein [Bacteroidia bacterium]NNL90589.1 hypothetical protein [Saprospiraceae bacterium]